MHLCTAPKLFHENLHGIVQQRSLTFWRQRHTRVLCFVHV